MKGEGNEKQLTLLNTTVRDNILLRLLNDLRGKVPTRVRSARSRTRRTSSVVVNRNPSEAPWTPPMSAEGPRVCFPQKNIWLSLGSVSNSPGRLA